MAFPNQTIYNAGQAGQGTAPATVDFVALSPNEYNVTEAQGTATFPISGISKARNNDGGTTFNGEVRAVTDGFKPSDGQQIKVSLVLRDKQGTIIYGEMAFVDWPDMANPCLSRYWCTICRTTRPTSRTHKFGSSA